MVKQTEKEKSDKIKARKIVKQITKWLSKSVTYKFKDYIEPDELTEAVKEFMSLVVRANKVGAKEDYSNNDKTYFDVARDFLSLQHISIKEWTLSDLGIKREDFFEVEQPTI